MTLAYAVLASTTGALTRLLTDSLIRTRWTTVMPWATILINVTGSALLGFVAGAVLVHSASDAAAQIIGTGYFGGFTTFSSASFETVRLLQQGRSGSATVNAALSALASVIACGIGMAAATAL